VPIAIGLLLGGCRRTPDPRLEKGRTLGPALDAPAGANWNSAAVEYDVDSKHTSTNTPLGHLSGEDWVVTHTALIRHPGGEARIELDRRVDCCRTSYTLIELAAQRYELRTHSKDKAAILVVRSDGKFGALAVRAPATPAYCKHLPKDAASWDADGAASLHLVRDMLGARAVTDSPPEHRPDSRAFAHDEGRAALAAACAEPDDAELGLAMLEWHLLRGRATTEISLIEQTLGASAAREACLTNAVQKHERVRLRLHEVLRDRPPAYQEGVRFVIATRALAAAADEASQVVLAEATRDALASEEVSAVTYGWPLVQELVRALARITQTRRRAPPLVRQVLAGLGASTDVELAASRRLAAEALALVKAP